MPLRRIALVTLLAFGCATVRVPVTTAAEPSDAPGVIAPPVVELWIESSEEVPKELSAKADEQARAAIAEALAGREIQSDAAGATDAVLFVRERAVATTEARNSQQTWAKVGIVASIVLIIAAVVLIVVATQGSSSHSGGSSGKSSHATAPKSSGKPVAVRPATPHAGAPGRVAPPPPAPRPPPLPPPPVYYYGWGHGPPVSFWLHLDFWIPPRPLVLEPEEGPAYAPEPPVPFAPDAPLPPDQAGWLAASGAEPPPPDVEPGIALQLPPLAPVVDFKVEDRGFFAGPLTAIQLDLLDRATGNVLWTKAVSADADPLDAKAVAKVLDEAFAGVEWAFRRR